MYFKATHVGLTNVLMQAQHRSTVIVKKRQQYNCAEQLKFNHNRVKTQYERFMW